MKFVWGGDRAAINAELVFSITPPCGSDTLEIYAADTYRVFADGKLISYGPQRCAAGYARKRRVPVLGYKLIEVKVLSFGIPNFSVDKQDPYFAFRLLKDGIRVMSTDDLSVAYVECERIVNMPRYSAQRGFVPGYDLTRVGRREVKLYPVESPKLLEGAEDVCDYPTVSFSKVSAGVFCGFDSVKTPGWFSKHPPREDEFPLDEVFERGAKFGYTDELYELEKERSGFVSLEIEAEEEGEIVAVFEEICPDEKWIYRRSNNNDAIHVRYPKGSHRITVSEPLTMRLLRIIHPNGVKVRASLIILENCRAGGVTVDGDERVVKVFEAARNTFVQNALDIFMDCPGRERAGWLCDSYFTAIAERMFTGRNDIERAFLENFILADTEEIADGMLPMCFPAQHANGRYIPNWAMWFVIELWDRYKRTGDRQLVDLAKDKVYGVVRFFDKYKNEFGLLEDLESWVFIEWSICNDDEYVKGVNYPSNMLYAFMLDKVAELYSDPSLSEEASNMRKQIYKLGWNGVFYVDNATRVGGKLKNCEDHLSETCQYYALYMGLPHDEKFQKMMVCEFGPLRTDAYPEVGKSNMFIGNYLRFFWLLSLGERERMIHESLEYFAKMANTTGTLWEHDRATASCNHGFASVAAVLLLMALVGYETVENGKAVLTDGFKAPEGYEVKVNFDYK